MGSFRGHRLTPPPPPPPPQRICTNNAARRLTPPPPPSPPPPPKHICTSNATRRLTPAPPPPHNCTNSAARRRTPPPPPPPPRICTNYAASSSLLPIASKTTSPPPPLKKIPPIPPPPPPSKGPFPPLDPTLLQKSDIRIPNPPPLPSSQSSNRNCKVNRAASASDGANEGGGRHLSKLYKPKVRLIDWRRSLSCDIILSKIKMPVPELINAILSLDSSALGFEQAEDLIRFFPTKVEMEMLKNYSGDKRMLGNCEQFFLDLIKFPRVKSKLRAFVFVATYASQVEDVKLKLNIVSGACREIMESVHLHHLMRTILALGVPISRASTSRPTKILKLESLLGLPGTCARNNKTALLRHLQKILAQRKPELLNFSKDLVHLEPASKIPPVSLAEEMCAVIKGFDMLKREVDSADNDGAMYSGFLKVLASFVDNSVSQFLELNALYVEVGRFADSLPHHFLDDPTRYPFDKVIETFVVFTKLLTGKTHDENKQSPG